MAGYAIVTRGLTYFERGRRRVSCCRQMRAGRGLYLRSRIKSRFDRVQASEQLSRPGWPNGRPAERSRLPPIDQARSISRRSSGWTMAAVSAVMVAIVRWPLGSPHWFVFVKAFLLLGAVIACATLFTVRHVERGGAYAALLVSTLAVIFLPCVAWLNGHLADVVTYPLFVGLLVAGIAQTASAMRGCTRPRVGLCGCLRLPRRFRLFPVDRIPAPTHRSSRPNWRWPASTSWTLFFMPPSPTCSSSMAC